MPLLMQLLLEAALFPGAGRIYWSLHFLVSPFFTDPTWKISGKLQQNSLRREYLSLLKMGQNLERSGLKPLIPIKEKKWRKEAGSFSDRFQGRPSFHGI